MLYLFESMLPENKSVFFALKYIYGIGAFNSLKICRKLGFSSNLKIQDLSKEQITLISKSVEKFNFSLTNDLKKIKLSQRQKLISIKSYRGLRKLQGLPVRGQRTHTNAKTSKKVR